MTTECFTGSLYMYIKHVFHKIFFQIICDINLETYKIHNKTFTDIQT